MRVAAPAAGESPAPASGDSRAVRPTWPPAASARLTGTTLAEGERGVRSALGPTLRGELDVGPWRLCPHCFGQRRILECRWAPNGEGRIGSLETCGYCMGIGEVLR
jgi:hypothetical protein